MLHSTVKELDFKLLKNGSKFMHKHGGFLLKQPQLKEGNL